MKKIIILLTIALTLLSIFAISKAEFSSDIVKMLPLEDRVIAKQYQILKAFDAMGVTLFEVSNREKATSFLELKKTTDSIVSILKTDSIFLFDESITPAAFFELRNSMLLNWPSLFTKKDSVYISQRLNKDSLKTMLDKSLSSLFTLGSSDTDPFLIKNDPFGFYPILLAKLAVLRPASNITIRDGYLTNSENSRILLFAKNSDITDEKKLKSIISSAENLALKNRAEFIWMGGVRATIDNSDQIKRDINLTLPITVILILLICFGIYRNRYYGFLTFAPTIVGIIITFGIFSFFFDFPLITMGFGAALMGITVDFAIHYLYHKDSSNGNSSTLKVVKTPIIASAVTTAGAFTVLAFSKIPALSQLGILTSIGILVTASLTLIFLPVITPKNRTKNSSFINLSKPFVLFYRKFNTDKIALFFVAISLPLFLMIPKLSFDGNPNSMNGMSSESLLAEKKFNDHWNGIGGGAYLAKTSKDLDTLLQFFEENITSLTDSLAAKKIANSSGSFIELLPSEKRQLDNQRRWRDVFDMPVIDKMRNAIDSTVKKYSLPNTLFYNYIDSLQIRSQNNSVSLSSYPQSFKDIMISKSLVKKDDLWIGNVPIFAINDSLWGYIDSAATAVGAIGVNDAVLGIRIVTLIKKAFINSLFFIPFVIIIILAVTVRKIGSIFAIFAPTALSAGISLGLMAILNIKINIVTMMVFAFIFGLGIDYALLIFYMAIREYGGEKGALAQGAASVSVAAATTLSGLGILIFAGHPVISTLGSAGVIGIFSSYISAIIVVPPLVRRSNYFIKSY